MTAILITTVCIAIGQEAECRREVRIFDNRADCREMERPTRKYLEDMAEANSRIVFVGAVCKRERGA